MATRNTTFKWTFEEWDNFREILYHSECDSMRELIKKSINAYGEYNELLKKNKELQIENKELMLRNMRYRQVIDCVDSEIEPIKLEDFLKLKEENQILKGRLKDIAHISNSICNNKVRLSKQYVLDIKRLTTKLDMRFPY